MSLSRSSRWCVILCLAALWVNAVEAKVSFARGAWNPADWLMVKTFRWEEFSHWIQEDECIRNYCPTDCPKTDLILKRAPETYVSMVWKEPVTRGLTFSATFSFEYSMAPELVLIPPPVPDGKGGQKTNELWEIVLCNKGLNIWHLRLENGKTRIRRLAHVLHDFKPDVRYTLKATVLNHWTKEPSLTVTCGDLRFGCALPTLPDQFYAGITACEGVVRVYDFSLKSK